MGYAEQARALDTPEYSEEAGFYRLLGAAVRKARKRRHMSQMDLARVLGISQSCLSRAEKGESHFQLYQLMQAARALNVPLRSLIP